MILITDKKGRTRQWLYYR